MKSPVPVRNTRGSCVALGNSAVLIVGASGSGKSTLAVEMIALGCRLVADDYADLARCGDAVVVRAPQKSAGLVEVRELGILKVEHQNEAILRHVVDLDRPPAGRLPAIGHTELLGVKLELIEAQGVYGLASKLVVLLRGGRLSVAPS